MMQGLMIDSCRSLRPTSLPLLRCRTSLISARSRLACQPRCFHNVSNQGKQHRSVRAAAASAKKDQPRAASGFKEKSRDTARVVFDFARWKKHRSTNRYLRHITGLPVSALVRGLAGPLLYILVLATGVCVYEYCYQAGLLPIDFPDLELKSKEPFALTSFALSLLLVFRTNASYERWDGARKMWGLVLNRSRDIVRQGLAWIPHDQVELRSLLCRWTPAFSKSLMCHLRKDEDLEKELRGILLPYEIAAVMQAQHRPNYVMQVLASIVKEANLPTAAGLAMEQNITVFEDCLGGCERILRTPIPLFYTRHTSRFLMIMLTMLPFSLWGTCAWSTIPLTVVIAFLLLGVEEIGVAIEEPFSILALEAISNTALANVRELQATHSTSALSGDFVGDSDLVSAPQMLAIATASAVGNSIEEEYGGLGGMPWVQPGTALTAEEEEAEEVLRARQRSKRRW